MAKKKDDDNDETSGGSIAVNDAWTAMLAISLLALIVGSGFLFCLYGYLNDSTNDDGGPRRRARNNMV